MNFLELFQTFGSNVWLYGGAFLLVLSILVFIHEMGHYVVARMCGVRVETFSIGFGPELFGINDSHGTRWKFSLIPLGGYVKMYGDTDPASASHVEEEDIPDSKKHEAFYSKTVGQRSAIVFAGPAINYIFAIIVMALVFSFQGQPLTKPQAAAIVAGSAAETAGFEPGDMIKAINGESIRSFESIRRAMLVSLDDESVFTVKRGEREIELTAVPEKKEHTDRFGFKSSRGFLGIVSPEHAVPLSRIVKVDGRDVDLSEDGAVVEDSARDLISERFGRSFWVELDNGVAENDRFFITPQQGMNVDFAEVGYLVLAFEEPEIFVKYTPLQALGYSIYESWDITVSTFQALGQMIVGQRSAQELGGLIRIGAIAGDVAQNGFIALCMFAALLSINLGLINLFPIPVLDGGHLVFYALEAIRGKPVPEQAQEYAFKAGFVFLIALMLFANINDLVQIFGNGGA
jgi:regulator of sigma E protease